MRGGGGEVQSNLQVEEMLSVTELLHGSKQAPPALIRILHTPHTSHLPPPCSRYLLDQALGELQTAGLQEVALLPVQVQQLLWVRLLAQLKRDQQSVYYSYYIN